MSNAVFSDANHHGSVQQAFKMFIRGSKFIILTCDICYHKYQTYIKWLLRIFKICVEDSIGVKSVV